MKTPAYKLAIPVLIGSAMFGIMCWLTWEQTSENDVVELHDADGAIAFVRACLMEAFPNAAVASDGFAESYVINNRAIRMAVSGFSIMLLNQAREYVSAVNASRVILTLPKEADAVVWVSRSATVAAITKAVNEITA